MGGPAGLVGRAMAVRIASYRSIAARGSDAPRAVLGLGARSPWTRCCAAAPRARSGSTEVLSLDPFAARAAGRARPGGHPGRPAARHRARRDQRRARRRAVPRRAATAVAAPGSRRRPATRSSGRSAPPACEPGSRTSSRTCATDVLHRLNPTALHDGARSYAGAPLITASGEVLGNCCVIDVVAARLHRRRRRRAPGGGGRRRGGAGAAPRGAHDPGERG